MTTDVTTATAEGGIGPYDYEWTRTDGGPGTVVATAPNGQATAFELQTTIGPQPLETTWQVKATDSRGFDAFATVTATFTLTT